MAFTLFKRQESPQESPIVTGLPLPGAMPVNRSSSPALTVDLALTMSAVYRAVDVIQTAASQLTLDAWYKGAPADKDPALLPCPDPEISQTEFTRQTVSNLALTGNAYWWIFYNSDGRVSGLRLLQNDLCQPVLYADTGRRTVLYGGKEYGSKNIYHVRKMTLPGRAEGLGAIQAAATELAGAKEMNEYIGSFTAPGSVPTGLLTTEQKITKTEADDLRKRWEERNAGIAVLGQGTGYKPIAISPADLQFLESRNFDVLAISRLFGIPPRLMNAAPDGGTMTYANLQDDDISFIRWTIMSYLRPIEDGLSFILPAGWQVRYNLDAILRPSTRARYEAHKIGIEAGFLNVDEVRKIEGLA